jgi:hypothetical protein
MDHYDRCQVKHQSYVHRSSSKHIYRFQVFDWGYFFHKYYLILHLHTSRPAQSHFLPVGMISEERITGKFSVQEHSSPIWECNILCLHKESDHHECPYLWFHHAVLEKTLDRQPLLPFPLWFMTWHSSRGWLKGELWLPVLCPEFYWISLPFLWFFLFDFFTYWFLWSVHRGALSLLRAKTTPQPIYSSCRFSSFPSLMAENHYTLDPHSVLTPCAFWCPCSKWAWTPLSSAPAWNLLGLKSHFPW